MCIYLHSAAYYYSLCLFYWYAWLLYMTGIGNGRFGEVWKAEVKNICQESPLKKLACIKIFQGKDTSLKLLLSVLPAAAS